MKFHGHTLVSRSWHTYFTIIDVTKLFYYESQDEVELEFDELTIIMQDWVMNGTLVLLLGL